MVTLLNSDFIGPRSNLSDAIIEGYGEDLQYIPTGIYNVNVTSTTYLPYHWGTLIHFFSGMEYGCFMFTTTTGKMYYRQYHRSDLHWYSNWQEVVTKSDLGNIGSYKLLETGVSNLDNPPNAVILETSSSGSNIAGFPTGLSGNRVLVLQLLPGEPMYSAQLAFGFNSDKIAIRRKPNSITWTDWKYFTAS